MQQDTVDCQLSREEQRTLALAELDSQSKLLTTLKKEARVAMQRIERALLILADTEGE